MGIVSRVALPDLKTPSTFEKVRLPSGVTDPGRKPGVSRRGVSASLSIAIFRPGNRPPVTDMMAAFAPPTKNPSLKASRMFRVQCRSFMIKDVFTERSYSASRPADASPALRPAWIARSEEHTSELQSPFLISYAVFCLKKKKIQNLISLFLYIHNKKKK